MTGLANLAVKVADLDAACRFYEDAGAEIRDRIVGATVSEPTCSWAL